ncbi:MAG: tetratricopeptide repeat protein, partial [Clostridia bacterium]|nr:tetratricopeptide repeat protein [Deltaproteobacteria bacterium]
MLRTFSAIVFVVGFGFSAFAQEAATGASALPERIPITNADQVIKDYGAAVQKTPDDAQAHYVLGLAYFKKGEVKRAVDEFKRVTELAPTDDDGFYALGLTLRRAGDNQNAAAAFHRAVDQSTWNA